MPSIEDFLSQIDASRLKIDVDGVSANLLPTSCDLTEEIGQPFTIIVSLFVRDRSLMTSNFVGKKVKIEYAHESGSRWFHGVCTSGQLVESEHELLRVQLEIRPSLWLLTNRRDNRVFQNMTALDIVLEVLANGGVPFVEVRVQSPPPSIEYCIQYDETDYNFVMRMMEEHGLYFFYDHDESGEIMVMCNDNDDNNHFPLPNLDNIDYFDAEHIPPGGIEHITGWMDGNVHSTFRVAHTDYNPETSNTDLATAQDATHAFDGDQEAYFYPGGYGEIPEGDRRAEIMAQALTAHGTRATARSNIYMLRSGSVFTLQNHTGSRNIKWLITGTRHSFRGDSGSGNHDAEEHSCEIDMIPQALKFRMPVVTPRPRIVGVQTAVVVGPAGEEIYTDAMGRVKIQFHWDRLGGKNEDACMYCRVATPWAGTNWGQIAIPRIGQEVLVQFQNGNCNMPVITGMMYNTPDNPVPLNLPDDAHTVGIKTNSTPGGGGANELWMKDAAGSELFTVVAQRNFYKHVKRDSTTNIGNDCHIDVGYDVGDSGSYTFNVKQDRIETVSNGDYNLGVDTGNRNTYVKTNDKLEVKGAKTDEITGDYNIKALANMKMEVTDKLSEKATNVEIEGTTDLKIKSPDVNIDGSTTLTLGSAEINVDGSDITITGSGTITLGVGSNTITISSGGVEIKGSEVKLNS